MRNILALLMMLISFHAVADCAFAAKASVNGGGILYTKPLRAVLFTHKTHLTVKKMSCERCHSGLFEMEALKVQEAKDFNMESLYKGKYCGACHNGRTAFASDTQCARCHIRVAGEGPKADIPVYKAMETFGSGKRSVRFNHDTHSRYAKCSGCHPKLFRVKQGTHHIVLSDHDTQKYCFACHNGKKSFSWNKCDHCHTKTTVPREVVTFGTGEMEIIFRHQTHTGNMTCGSCHTKLFSFRKGTAKITMADHRNGTYCFSCHKDKNGSASYTCTQCHKGSASGPSQVLVYDIKDQKPVRFNHASHSPFKCNQCHPNLFAMKKGGTKMTMTEMYQAKSCGTCHDGKMAFRAMDCAKCHQ